MNKADSSTRGANDALPDEVLMRRFRETADEAAFDEIILRYHRPALIIARDRLPKHSALAEDAVQEAFIRTVRNRDSFDCRKSFAAWFYTILRNVCLDYCRKEMRREKQLQEIAQQEEPAANDSIAHRDMVAAILQTLAPTDREILIYRFIHGLTIREIAEQLGLSDEAVKKRAQRALKHLRTNKAAGGLD